MGAITAEVVETGEKRDAKGRRVTPTERRAQMVQAFLHTTVHNNEIYGNIVGYLRANHITPPSTEMVQEMIKAKKTPEQMFKEMMEKYGRKPGG